jgi:hypothetical protein
MRSALLFLCLCSLWLVALLGCESVEVSDQSGGDSDADADSDADSDTDVPVQHPEAINPLLDPWGVMTGPISPPPENIYDKKLTGVGDADAGAPGEDLDEDLDAGATPPAS